MPCSSSGPLQGCYSEFGSNKVRKKVKQGKEKRLLARILIFLEKARKRLSRQNSTIKVRKCEEKRPKFYKKHTKGRHKKNCFFFGVYPKGGGGGVLPNRKSPYQKIFLDFIAKGGGRGLTYSKRVLS